MTLTFLIQIIDPVSNSIVYQGPLNHTIGFYYTPAALQAEYYDDVYIVEVLDVYENKT